MFGGLRSRQKLTFSSMKLRQPSRGTKAVTFFPFLTSCALTHLRMAELGCFASIPLYTRNLRPVSISDRRIKENITQLRLHFLQYYSLCVRSTLECRMFIHSPEHALPVGLICPAILTTVVGQLTRCLQPSRLTSINNGEIIKDQIEY